MQWTVNSERWTGFSFEAQVSDFLPPVRDGYEVIVRQRRVIISKLLEEHFWGRF